MEPIFKNIKAEALRQIQQLPDDCTMDDVSDRIQLMAGVMRGFRDIEEGRLIPQEEAERRRATYRSSGLACP